MPPITPHLYAFLLALTGYSIFTLSDTVMKFLAQGHALPLRMAIFYLSGASFIVISTLLRKRSFAAMRPQLPVLHVIRGFIILIGHTCFFTAFARLPMADVYGIIYLMPVVLTILAGLLLAEHISRRQIASIVLGWVGAMVIIQPRLDGMDPVYSIALCGVLMVCVNVIFLRKYGQKETPESLSFSTQIIVGSVMLALVLMNAIAFNFSGKEFLFLSLSGAMAGGAMMMLTRAIQTAPVSVIAPTVYVQILWGIIFGAVFFGDMPDMVKLSGAALVIMAGLLLIRRKPRAIIP